jgi:dTDP-4-dehydrorhamnose 3,5-epimerase
MGAVHDVILDLRRESPTFGIWTAVELTAENRRMLYVPRGFAHGFQTLCDHAEVFYQMSAPYHAGSARGIRWDDSFLNIAWPLPPTRISEQDRGFPGLAAYTATGEPGPPILH